MSTRLPNHRAFSLLELIIAMALVILVSGAAALAIPRVDAALQLDAALHQIAADLQSARTLAVASARRVRIVFTAGADRYSRELADDAGQYHPDRSRTLPRGIRVLAVNAGGTLAFSARGQAENATVTLADAQGTARALQLNQRGRVTILPPP